MIRLGIVGAGEIIQKIHLPILSRYKANIHITGIYSKTGISALKTARKFGIKNIYQNKQDVFNDTTNAILIAVPISTASTWIKKGIHSGKYVICEKPCAADTQDLNNYRDLTADDKEKCFIAENQLFFDYYRDLADLIKKNSFGKIKEIRYQIQRFYTPENDVFLKKEWRRNPKHLGGYLYDYGLHHFSLFHRLNPGFKFVSGRLSGYGNYDRYPSNMEWNYEDGEIKGRFSLDYYHFGNQENIFKIITENGALIIERNRIKFTGNNGKIWDKRYARCQLNDSFANEWQAFIDFMAGKTSNPHSLRNGMDESAAFFNSYQSSKFE